MVHSIINYFEAGKTDNLQLFRKWLKEERIYNRQPAIDAFLRGQAKFLKNEFIIKEI